MGQNYSGAKEKKGFIVVSLICVAVSYLGSSCGALLLSIILVKWGEIKISITCCCDGILLSEMYNASLNPEP